MPQPTTENSVNCGIAKSETLEKYVSEHINGERNYAQIGFTVHRKNSLSISDFPFSFSK